MAALRALAASANNDNAERLMRFVEDEQATLNARTLAAVLLADMGARQMKQRLQDYAPRASTEETGLGIKSWTSVSVPTSRIRSRMLWNWRPGGCNGVPPCRVHAGYCGAGTFFFLNCAAL